MNNIFPVVIGTAGHIDHGKSSLVKVLTGIDPDRLKEEKERGITIDLGFAPFLLPDGRSVGIVDVPGHEKFIKNMVAGATGIDFVILVIAADDGVMPQTREHLEIMQFLEIKSGMVALNKIDLVDAELAALAQEEIREFLKGTFLEKAPIAPVSTVTGQGLADFKNILFRELQKITPHTPQGIFRMPIQRIFSKHGYGTVITGIPVTGTIHVGDTIEVLPGGQTGRIKKIHAYGQDVESAQAGHSTALNVKDIDYNAIQRGQVAAIPGYFHPVHFIEGKFEYLSRFKEPLEHNTSIRFHTGTVEEMGKIAILGEANLQPGYEGYVQIRLDNPVLTVPGDKFVVRLSSPMITIGGGVVVGIGEKKLKRFRSGVVELLEKKEESLENLDSKLELAVKEAGISLIREADIFKISQMSKEEFEKILSDLLREGRILKITPGVPRYIHREVLQNLEEKIMDAVQNFFHQFPYRIYMKKLELKNRMQIDSQLLDFVLLDFGSKKCLLPKEDTVFVPGRSISFTESQQKLLESLEKCFTEQLFSPPSPAELPQILHKPYDEILPVLEFLCESGRFVEVEKEIIFHIRALEKAKEMIVKTIQSQGELVASDFRDVLQTSRKYIIPLLEYFDKAGLTIRKGNSRILKT